MKKKPLLIIKALSSFFAFLLFIMTFSLYDTWNAKLLNLEFSGMRYHMSANGNNTNKILYQINKNPHFLANAAKSLTDSFVSNMVNLDLGEVERQKYLNPLVKFADNKLTSAKVYEQFEDEYNKTVDRFLLKEYNPKIEKLKLYKKICRYGIIIVTAILFGVNLFIEIKYQD
jgi:hypothetical protein